MFISEVILTSLNLTILTLAISLYLLSLKNKTKPTWYLLGAIGCFCFSNIVFLGSGLGPDMVNGLGYLLTNLAGVSLIQFSYHFPQLQPAYRKEAKAVLLISLGISFLYGRFTFFLRPSTTPESVIMFWGWAMLELAWALIVLFRQFRHLSQNQPDSWWYKILHPATKPAQACRNFLLSFGFLLFIPMVRIVIPILGNIPPALNLASTNAFLLIFFFTAVLVYLNQAQENITFMVKLVGISLTTMLIIVGNLWVFVLTLAEDVYLQNISLPQTNHTYRFRPNAANSYDVSLVDFNFEPDLGDNLEIWSGEWAERTLPFSFTIYNQPHTKLYASPRGLITFRGNLPEHPVYEIHQLDHPTIVPLAGQFIPLNHTTSGLFYKADHNKTILTWHNFIFPQPKPLPEYTFSVQLTLYPDNSFDITYVNLFTKEEVEPLFLEGVGVYPGYSNDTESVIFNPDLNFYSYSQPTILQNYSTIFATHMHQHLRPFAGLTIVVSLIILGGFPFFFQANLVAPLNHLVDGVKEVNNGNLNVNVPVEFNDELGFLAGSFNGMLRNLQQAEEARLHAALLTKEKEAAQKANQAKSTFLANMSHELRSPLNAILGFSQIINRDQNLPRDVHKNMGIIMRSSEHLLALINQVLDLSKIEAGRTTLDNTDFDLPRLLHDLEDMFSFKADKKQLQLIFDYPATLPQYIRTDQVKLRQVLINLLNNALKFTDEGGVRCQVSSITHQPNTITSASETLKTGKLLFTISDTGPGILPDDLDKLFEAFTQTETGHQAQEGTGLGLPISRKFIQLMGGDISVTSKVGYGTQFKFNIQVQQVDTLKSISKKQPSPIIGLEPDQPHYRILVVDDKWINRQLLIKLLSPLAFELREAENGQEAIDIWQTFDPHLIWMDMRMPVLDGFEATKRIKATTKGQATAIIALTASSFEEERAIILSAGCDDFVRKPFRNSEPFAMMSKHIGVKYVYQNSKPQSDQIDPEQAIPLATLSTQLSQLLPTLRNQLTEGVELSDLEKIDNTIANIRPYNQELARVLTKLVNSFEYTKILAALQGINV